jgi:hypothetical protein
LKRKRGEEERMQIGGGGVGVEGSRQESEVSHYNAKDYSRPRERNSSYQLLTDPASSRQIPPATDISWQFLPAPNRYWQLLEYPSIYLQTLKVSTRSWLFFLILSAKSSSWQLLTDCAPDPGSYWQPDRSKRNSLISAANGRFGQLLTDFNRFWQIRSKLLGDPSR